MTVQRRCFCLVLERTNIIVQMNLFGTDGDRSKCLCCGMGNGWPKGKPVNSRLKKVSVPKNLFDRSIVALLSWIGQWLPKISSLEVVKVQV